MSLPSSFVRPALLRSFTASRIPRASFASSSSQLEEAGPSKKLKGKKKNVISSCIAGTNLTGLSILKDERDPKARPDEEYPDWLWGLLSNSKVSDLAGAAREVPKAGKTIDFDREKQRLRAQNRANIKAANFLKGA